MRVLNISADRSSRGILNPESPAAERQFLYGERFGHLDIIGFSRRSDGRARFSLSEHVKMYPTNSYGALLYGFDAVEIARGLRRPDVVSAQDPFETGFVALLISIMKRVPLHIQIHTDFVSREYAQHSFVNSLRVLIAGFVLRHAARIRVVSGNIKKNIEKQYHLTRTPITVLPIFVDFRRFHSIAGDPELEKRFEDFATKLLVVSRLEPEKNVALAIRSFATAAPHNTCLIIVGDGSKKKTLKKIAGNLGVAERVFFEQTDHIETYYKLADLVLVTSQYEGYGMVTIEALAAGKPVLSTDVGIARESGAIVTTPEGFATALAAWLDDGPREGHLAGYPYKNLDEYVQAYCDDIAAAAKTGAKSLHV